MRTRTVTELHQAFLIRGGFRNSVVWDITTFLEVLNTAIGEVWRLLADSWQDYCLYEATSTSTVIGTETYACPADFWRLKLLEVSRSVTTATVQEYEPMSRVGLLVLNRLRQQSGDPFAYTLRGVSDTTAADPKIILAPKPSAVRKIRFTYIPAPPVMTAGDDIWDGVAGYDKLLLELCLYDAYKRAKMPVGECANEIARLSKELEGSAPNRDGFEPETIAEHMRTGYGRPSGWMEDDF